MSKHDILQIPSQRNHPPIASQVLKGRASPPKDSQRVCVIDNTRLLSKARSKSLPAWQCWLSADLVSISEADGHSTVVRRGCSRMSRRKVHG